MRSRYSKRESVFEKKTYSASIRIGRQNSHIRRGRQIFEHVFGEEGRYSKRESRNSVRSRYNQKKQVQSKEEGAVYS